jgi:hypothetical protein
MSGSQQVGTSQRKSARLEKKRGDVIGQDLSGINLGERLRTFHREEGDVVVLSWDEPTQTSFNPEETTGQSGSPARTDPESEEDIFDIPMSQILKYFSLNFSNYFGLYSVTC